MNRGAFVLIFAFWALLTILAPILVQWSAAAATAMSVDGSNTGDQFDGKDTGASKLMVLAEEIHWMQPLLHQSQPPELAKPPAEPPVSARASKGQKEEKNYFKKPADDEVVTEMLPIINSRRLLLR